jgi:hypothetical protein
MWWQVETDLVWNQLHLGICFEKLSSRLYQRFYQLILPQKKNLEPELEIFSKKKNFNFKIGTKSSLEK